MSENTKGQVEQILAELGKKMDQLITETKKAGGDVREDLEVRIAELRQKKTKIEEEFSNYKDKNEDKWTEAKQHLGSAMIELKKAIEAVFKETTKSDKP